MVTGFKIIGTGSFVPERIVSNAELAMRFDTSDVWIREKIGIRERRFAKAGQGAADLGHSAALQALEQARIKAADLDAIVFSTTTPEFLAPGSGHLMQQKLGCGNIPVFEVRQTSPGFLFGLEQADGLIKTGRYKTVLVVGAEVFSNRLDFTDRGRLMAVIFGDGAGAIIIQVTDEKRGLVDCVLHSDPTDFDKLCHKGVTDLQLVEQNPQAIIAQDLYPKMDGPYVFKKSVKSLTQSITALLSRNQLTPQDIDFLFCHQANSHIIEAVGKKLGLDPAKVPSNIESFGNTSSASIPLLLDELHRAGRIKRGQKMVLASFGSGFCWGAGLLIW